MARIVIIIFIFINANTQAFSLSLDSANRFLSFHFNRRGIEGIELNQGSDNPFKNNYAYSASIMGQRTLYRYKRLNLNGYAGLTGQILRIGKIETIQYGRSLNAPVNTGAFMLGIASGLSIDMNILKFRNSRLLFGAGIWGNGIIYNTKKTEVIVNERNDFYGNDSVVISFKKNSFFYITPFYQLTLKTKFKSKAMIVGLKVMFAFNEASTNIDYAFYQPRFPLVAGRPTQHWGYFGDTRPQFVVFFGLTI